jgi:hypothetical protein
MSSDPHGASHQHGNGEPIHPDVSFETKDVRATTIYGYLFVLAIAVVLSYVVCVFVLRITTKMAAQSDAPMTAARQRMGSDYQVMPPEPRLQGVTGHTQDAQADLRELEQRDEQANQKLGWIDRNADIAQIPVKDAMKIIADKGLPGASAPSGEKK